MGVCLPIFGVTAIAIKLCRKARFFQAGAPGAQWKKIDAHKFRTMHANAEEGQKHLAAMNERMDRSLKSKETPVSFHILEPFSGRPAWTSCRS